MLSIVIFCSVICVFNCNRCCLFGNHRVSIFINKLHGVRCWFTFSNLGGLDLSTFNVLILPHGKYDSPLAPDEKMVRKLKEWVRSGGTLLLMKDAAAWACGEKVGLLGSRQVRIRETEESGAGQNVLRLLTLDPSHDLQGHAPHFAINGLFPGSARGRLR
jgi:hypothetical protein